MVAFVATSGGPADAGACTPVKDTAQYHKEARTAQGRKTLADQYCLYARLGPLQQASRDRDECRDAQSRMIGALRAADDPKMVDRALSGCPDIFDKRPPPARTNVFKCEAEDGTISFSTTPCRPGLRALPMTDSR